MKIQDLLIQRQTIHSFTSEPVSNEILTMAMETAIQAPNHKHTWPWRFFVVGKKTREQLCKLQTELTAKKSKTPMSDEQKKVVAEKFMEAGALLLVGIPVNEDASRHREDYAALAMGIENMSLYLWSQNIGSKWATGQLIRSPEMYKIAGIDQAQIEICGLFWIGHAKEVKPKPARPPLSEFVTQLE